MKRVEVRVLINVRLPRTTKQDPALNVDGKKIDKLDLRESLKTAIPEGWNL